MIVDKKKRCRLAISHIRNSINVNSYRFNCAEIDYINDPSGSADNRGDKKRSRPEYITTKAVGYFAGEYRSEYALMFSILELAILDLAENDDSLRERAEYFLKNSPWCNRYLKINDGYVLRILKRYELIS